MAGSVQLLAAYPAWVGERLCSVHTGLPSKHDFMPAIKTLKAACEAEFSTVRYAAEWEARTNQARIAPPPQVPRPTLKELQDKYGPNWGITEAHEELDRSKTLQKANEKLRQDECRANGIDPSLGVTAGLWKRIRGE